MSRFLVACVLILGSLGSAQTLRASHQWPQGDLRDKMVQLIKTEVEAADVGLDVRVFPGSSLFGADEQWDAVTQGQLDITALPLDYASGDHPEFSATLMPGLVKSYEHAQRIDKSEFMNRIKGIINDAGAVVLADTWLAGGFTSSEDCILVPENIKGQNYRAAGPYFEKMLAGAGASIVSMPSSEAYTGLQTKVIDGLNTSDASFLSYRIYEQVKCLTPSGDNALWFMYEPILMSSRTFDRLSPEQQDALMAAGKKASEYAYSASADLEQTLINTFQENGVEIANMNREQWQQWIDLAQKTAYADFMSEVPDGKELIELARQVE